jgi:hypothetical protein
VGNTYSRVSSSIQNVDATFGRQGLRTRNNALCAVDDTPPAGKLLQAARRRREQGWRGERHLGRQTRTAKSDPEMIGLSKPVGGKPFKTVWMT